MTRGRHRQGLLLASLPLVTAAVVLAVVLAVVRGSGTPSPPKEAAAQGQRSAVSVVAVQPADEAAGPVVLERIAVVAAQQPSRVPGPDQFVYVRTTSGGLDLSDPQAPVYVSSGDRRVWIPQRPDGKGLIMQDGVSTLLNPELGGGQRPDSYAALLALPQDPVALLAQVRAHEASAVGAQDPAAQVSDAALFQALGALLQDSLTPPGVSATIYRAAALLAGVSEVPDAVDGAGRPGVGLAVTDEVSGVRYEWVLDPDRSTYLGSREYLVRDTDWGKAGTLVAAHAVLGRAVVESAGQAPRQDQLSD